MQIRLDWDQLLANITSFHQQAAANGRLVRPHVKGHRLAAVTREQLARGARGIIAQTLNEAVHHASSNSIKDVVIARPVTEFWRLARYVRERHRLQSLGTRLIVQLDDIERVADAATLTAGAASPVAVRLELDGGAGRGLAHDELLWAAHLVASSPGLCLDGVTAYCVPESEHHADRWPEFTRRHALALVAAATALRSDRIACPVVSLSGTVNAHHIDTLTGINEVAAGCYALSDADTAMRTGLAPALRIRATRHELATAARSGGILADCAQDWAPTTSYRQLGEQQGPVVDVAPSHLCPLLVHDLGIESDGRLVRPEIFPDHP